MGEEGRGACSQQQRTITESSQRARYICRSRNYSHACGARLKTCKSDFRTIPLLQAKKKREKVQLDEDVKGQKEGRYLLGVGAVPVDAVALRGKQPGADAHDQSRNPDQIHGGSEETRRAGELARQPRHALKRKKKKRPKKVDRNSRPRVGRRDEKKNGSAEPQSSEQVSRFPSGERVESTPTG